MKITRRLSISGNFDPLVVDLLSNLPSTALFYVSHNLRHPDAIYSLSLSKLGNAFCKVAEGYLSKMQEYQKIAPSGAWEINQLLADQESFLHALQEHLDDLWLILKTLVDPALATKDAIFSNKYVVANKLPGAKTFESAISDYKGSMRITNKLKHQQARLRGVAIWLPNGSHFGYFLEEPDARGVIGPSPAIHPDQGAISFARDLRWHLFNVYLCSEKLSTAISSVLNSRGLSLAPGIRAGNKEWERVVSLALKIPEAYFPKEAPKHAAIFRLDDADRRLEIEFPRRILTKFPAQIRTTCSTQGDGYSKSFRVPFP